jgi:hypothetical protein
MVMASVPITVRLLFFLLVLRLNIIIVILRHRHSISMATMVVRANPLPELGIN